MTQQMTTDAKLVQESTLAIVSLVAGIAGWTIVPVLGAIVAVITGHLAKNEIRESNGQIGSDRLATAGLVLGYACLGCIALLVLASMAYFFFFIIFFNFAV